MCKNSFLVSRSGQVKHSEQGLEERLTKLLQQRDGSKCTVSIECCDMSNESEVQSLLKRVREKHAAINTIVHASGTIHDGLLHNMTAEAVRDTFGPKAAGPPRWNGSR